MGSLEIQDTQIPVLDPAIQAGATPDPYRAPFMQTDPAAVKEVIPTTHGKVKYAASFQEKFSFLFKEKTEHGGVKLLVICLYLGKVGVDRQVEHRIGIDPILDIKSGFKFVILAVLIGRFGIV